MSLAWTVKAASVPGTRHRQNGSECQDAFFWQQPANGLLVAAVADGAGSARHSALASRIASQSAVEWLVAQQHSLAAITHDDQWHDVFNGAFTQAAQAVKEEAVRKNLPLAELSTTLIVVIATPELTAAAQIGDGVVIVNDDQTNLFAMTNPQHGEYRNETVFLNSKEALEKLRVFLWSGRAVHVALTTDGLELLGLNLRDGMPHAPFFDPLWKFSKGVQTEAEASSQLAAFLASPKIASRTDDDLTLVLGYLKEEAE